MATHLRLRAIRDFVASTHPDVRVLAGEALDLADAKVQQFLRAALNWDAFRLDFVDDNLSADDLDALRADLVTAKATAQRAADESAAAMAGYQAAQRESAAARQAIDDNHRAAADAGLPRDPATVAQENQRHSDALAAERAARDRFTAALATADAAANAAGALAMRVRAGEESTPTVPADCVVMTASEAATGRLAIAKLAELAATPALPAQPGTIDLVAAIANAEADVLAAVKGIGPKAAENLIKNCQAHLAALP